MDVEVFPGYQGAATPLAFLFRGHRPDRANSLNGFPPEKYRAKAMIRFHFVPFALAGSPYISRMHLEAKFQYHA